MHRVVWVTEGSAGSDNKADALKSLGFDEVFNYKTTTTEKALDQVKQASRPFPFFPE